MTPEPILYIVDDDDGMRDALCGVAEHLGLPVAAFASGEGFLACLDPHRPGPLLLDLRLPGMTGLELQQALARRGIDLPVILITGHGDDRTDRLARAAGAIAVLHKPFLMQALAEQIERALRRLTRPSSDPALGIPAMNDEVEQTPTVFVVDDDQAVRDALREALTFAGFRVQTCPGALDFLEVYTPGRAGCLILDVRMPELSGTALLRQLDRHRITLPIIVLTAHGDVEMAVGALKRGALEFLQKPCTNEVLIAAVEKALERDRVDRRRAAERRAMDRRLASLTERQRRVLDGLVAGHPHKVIARDLNLSVSAVESHRRQILDKLGARDNAEALRQVIGHLEDAGR